MNGRNLALGLVAGLAVASLAPRRGSRSAREVAPPVLAELRRAAEWLAEDDPEWAEGGCADMSGLLLDYAEERGFPGVRAVSGWAARAKNAKKGFPHAWLEVDGAWFDPSAHVNRIPLHTWVEDAGMGQLAIDGSYLDPDSDVREDNGFRLEALARAMAPGTEGSRGLFDWTPDRTPERIARDQEDKRTRAARQAALEIERQAIRRSSSLTAEQVRATLRAVRLPVDGDRVELVQRLARLDALRAVDPGTLGGMTVRQIKDLLAPLRAGRGLSTRARLLDRARELQGPLAPVAAREKAAPVHRAILWTNPFTGRTETLGWVHSAFQEQATVAAWRKRYEDAYRDAVHHVRDLHEPDVRPGGSGHPEASEADREAFFAIARLERSAMGPALAGDIGRLATIRRQVQKAIAGRSRPAGSRVVSRESVMQSPSFRAWFDGSKVVDAQGQPLITFHGTDAGHFSAFDTLDFGSWFAVDPETTDDYTDRDGEHPRVYPVYLAIRRPLVFPREIDLSDDHSPAKVLRAINRVNGTRITPRQIGWDDRPNEETLVAEFTALDERFIGVAQGLRTPSGQPRFDGIVAHEQGKETWCAFSPGQVKSAIGNLGTFDSTNPDISMNRFRGTRQARPS